VFHTGCPSIDICAQLEKQIDIVALQESISRVGVGTEIDLSEPFMIIMQHPVTDHFKEIDSEIMETFYAVSEIKMQKIWFWPNADIGTNIASKTLRRIRENNELDGFRFIKTLPPHTFLRLLSLSAVIVGNSSAGIREGSYLGVPCVNIGDRQIGRETAENVNHCSSNSLQIQKAIELHLDSGKFKSSVLYGDGSAAIKIVHAIESFFEYN
jgi:UDP-N-acetylglucosamine 2-epimerase